MIVIVILVVCGIFLIPAIGGFVVAGRSARDDRALNQMRARPGGIVTFETLEPWSDGTYGWKAATRYARNEADLRNLLATVPAGARNVHLVRDLPSEVTS